MAYLDSHGLETFWAKIKTLVSGKQDKLTAGTNITIDANNVISATGGGTSNHASLTNLAYANSGHTGFQAEINVSNKLPYALLDDVPTLVAGSNISITEGSPVYQAEYLGVVATSYSLVNGISTAGDFTFTMEVNAANWSSPYAIMPLIVQEVNNGLWLGMLNGYFVVRTYNGSNWISVSAPTAGQYVEVKVVRENGVTSLYYDDVLQGQSNVTFADSTRTFLFTDGGGSWSQYNVKSFSWTQNGTDLYDCVSAKRGNDYGLFNSATNSLITSASTQYTGGNIQGSEPIYMPTDVVISASVPAIPTTLSSFTDDLGSSPVHSHSQYLTAHQDISGKENTSNKVASVSIASTDTQYPTAKCLYDMCGNIEALLEALL